MWNKLERLLTVIIALAALTITGTSVYGAIFAKQQPRTISGGPPQYMKFWKDVVPISIPIGGPSDAPITIVMLSDLECPACRAFHETLTDVLVKHPNDVRALYVPMALPYHRFALPAARAAECANSMNRFRPWIDAVYEKQDSLGLRSWSAYAREAGIADTARIQACAAGTGAVARVDAGKAFAKRIGATGTPTVLMNGWRFSGPPSKEALEAAIDALSSGHDPV